MTVTTDRPCRRPRRGAALRHDRRRDARCRPARDPVHDAVIADVRTLLLRHVLFFPGQHLDAVQHLAFGRRFGELTPAHPVIRGSTAIPEVFEIDYTDRLRRVVRDGARRPAQRRASTGTRT